MIDSDDTTEGRLIIRSKRLVPRLAQASALAHAAGVGMLEDRQRGRPPEIRRSTPPPCVENVAVRQRLRAVVQSTRQIYRTTGALMWVLTVAQRLS